MAVYGQVQLAILPLCLALGRDVPTPLRSALVLRCLLFHFLDLLQRLVLSIIVKTAPLYRGARGLVSFATTL